MEPITLFTELMWLVCACVALARGKPDYATAFAVLAIYVELQP